MLAALRRGPHISIHAPPRGATDLQMRGVCANRISIHAPPRGATAAADGRPAAEQFQFTPLREGRRRREACASKRTAFQFTPLREGRPGWPRSTLLIPSYFNSRPSARGDGWQELPESVVWHFNSRPSARGDKRCKRLSTAFMAFQFTPLREGRPDPDTRVFVGQIISIHAPPRGATWWDALDVDRGNISIHAPPRGAT